MSKHTCDIAIVGAGIAGVLLANMLAKQTNLKIALIDHKMPEPNWQQDHYGQRVSAINHTSVRALQYLNVWQAISDKRVSPYHKMQVWDAASIGELAFDSDQLNLPSLGFIVENDLLQQTLLAALANEKQVTTFWPLALNTIQKHTKCIRLVSDQGVSIEAKLVIGADGGRSWVRQQAAISVREVPYHHSAIVTTVKTSKAHNKTAWQCFLPSGPLAFLPLADAHSSSIVWSCEPEKANRLLSMSDEDFKQALAKAFNYRLGAVTALSKRLSFPLVMRHADRYVAPSIALVGDAAHTIHPLAGQGLNLAIMDVICLADQIALAHAKGRRFASERVLLRYARKRKAENTVMVKAMGGFKQLFGSQKTSVILARSQGLGLVNRFKFIKKVFMRRAMGLSDELPEAFCQVN